MNPAGCDLCGLDLGVRPLPLDHAGQSLRFCCEGCLGIYCMLHGIEAQAAPVPANSPNPTRKGA